MPKIIFLFLKLMLVFGVIHPCFVLSRTTLQQQKQKEKLKLKSNLLLYAREGYLPPLRKMLQRSDINVNSTDEQGRGILHWVARREDSFQFIKVILRHPKININLQDKYGDSPLHYIVASRNYGETQGLLELLRHPQIDVNIQNNRGETPLHYASRYCLRKMVQRLLAHPKIAVNMTSKSHQTPLDYLCSRAGDIDIQLGREAIKQGLLNAGAISRKKKPNKSLPFPKTTIEKSSEQNSKTKTIN